VRLLLSETPADRADRRPPCDADDHVRVHELGQQSPGGQRHPLQALDLAHDLGHRNHVRNDAMAIPDALLEHPEAFQRRVDPDVDEAALPREAEQP